METRTLTEYKIYVLALNRMTSNTEHWEAVAISYERQKLIDWVNSLVEPKVEEGPPSFPIHGDTHVWHKTYKIGSPLEWFNPTDFNSVNHYGQGIREQWIGQDGIDRFTGTKLF